MGMELVYRRIIAAELARLEADSNAAQAFLFDSQGLDFAALTAMAGMGTDLSSIEANLAKNPKLAEMLESLENEPTAEDRFDLFKEWHAVSFLVTGDPSMETVHRPGEPLRNIVFGGHPTKIETGYGPARYLPEEDVQQIAAALKKISPQDFRARFSAEAFNVAEIYPVPRPGGWTEAEAEPAFELFAGLVEFFQEAANAGQIVVVYVT